MPRCHGNCLTLQVTLKLKLVQVSAQCSLGGGWWVAHLLFGATAARTGREMLGRVRPVLTPSHYCTCIHNHVQNTKIFKIQNRRNKSWLGSHMVGVLVKLIKMLEDKGCSLELFKIILSSLGKREAVVKEDYEDFWC